MNTLDLKQAAAFLRMHPEEVRRRAKLGLLPGAKPGKSWVFIEDDLAAWLRGQYLPAAPLPSKIGKEQATWQSTSAARLGGSTSPRHGESALDALLRQATGSRHRNSTTG
ncbi:helix-turn-helix domain-containing protein [Telluria sp. B2]